MHPIAKIYCRTFQLAFRIALPVLPYREPKLMDSLADIPALFEQKNIRSALLVTDASVRRLGLTASLEKALAAHAIRCTVYDAVVPNPTIANVEEARALYVQNHAQAIIAVGGGSAMDCAKAVGARIARPNKSVEKMRGLLRVLHRTPLTVAVPTTAGTGSETTLAAVITNQDTKHKYPINDFSLIPDYAVLDPELTRGLPPMLTATTGMDALTHAVEAYIGGSTTKLTRAMAEEAAQLIADHLFDAYQNGNDLTARRAMLRAAYCAGIAFTRSYVGYVHGLAHSLGGQYGVPHGLANAVILPHMLDAYGTACHQKLAILARKAHIASESDDTETAAQAFIAWVRSMNSRMGIPTVIDALREEDIPTLARHAAQECNPLYPVPVLMDRDELAAQYRRFLVKEVSHAN